MIVSEVCTATVSMPGMAGARGRDDGQHEPPISVPSTLRTPGHDGVAEEHVDAGTASNSAIVDRVDR
jgi:hypothetical protein